MLTRFLTNEVQVCVNDLMARFGIELCALLLEARTGAGTLVIKPWA